MSAKNKLCNKTRLAFNKIPLCLKNPEIENKKFQRLYKERIKTIKIYKVYKVILGTLSN